MILILIPSIVIVVVLGLIIYFRWKWSKLPYDVIVIEPTKTLSLRGEEAQDKQTKRTYLKIFQNKGLFLKVYDTIPIDETIYNLLNGRTFFLKKTGPNSYVFLKISPELDKITYHMIDPAKLYSALVDTYLIYTFFKSFWEKWAPTLMIVVVLIFSGIFIFMTFQGFSEANKNVVEGLKEVANSLKEVSISLGNITKPSLMPR